MADYPCGVAEPLVARRLNGERLVVFGWSRAILMQLAHPLLAAGVAEHSAFREGPLVAAARLRQTVAAMLSLTFGDAAAQARTLAGIQAIHRRVRGRLQTAVGPFPEGTPYSAEDPELVAWVHVTLLQSVPLAYSQLVAPVSDADWDRFCVEAAPTARALGASGPLPETRRETDAYVERMVGSGRLAVGPDAQALAAAVLRPFGGLAGPLARVNWLCTVGWLPEACRRMYGLGWTPRDAASLERWTRLVRRTRRMAPAWASRWRAAER